MNRNDLMKEVIKNVKKGIFTKIKRNDNFIIFSEKLKEHFNTHLMPANLEIIKSTKGQKSFYSFNTDIKVSKWCIKIFNDDICNITILPNAKGVELYRLEMYKTGQGFGSTFMNAINEVSKETGILVYLIPGEPGFNENGVEEKRRNFYHKFGFKRTSTTRYWSNEQIIN